MSVQKPKAKPPEQSEATTVIILLTLALIVIGYFVFFTENKSFILKAKFPQADGLKPGAELQCAGVKVGSVKEIRFLDIPTGTKEENVFELILELNPIINGQSVEKVIHKDATAIIIVVGALGDRGVNIVPGSLKSPPVTNGDYISGKIELTPAMVSANLQSIRKKFTTLQAMLEENSKWINQGHGNLGKYSQANNEEAVNLKKLLEASDKLQPLLEKGNGSLARFRRDKEIGPSIQNLFDLSDKLQELLQKGNGSAGHFFQDEEIEKRVNLLQERVKNISEKFEQMANKAQKGNGSAGRFINNSNFNKDLKQLEANFNKLSEKVSNKKGSLNLLMTDPRLSDNISAISVEMAKLAYDIRQKPRKYVKFTLF